MSKTKKNTEFKKGKKVKLHIYFSTGYFVDKNGNHYYDFTNFPAEEKFPKQHIVKRMHERICGKMLKGKHTGGQFYDFMTGERIAEVSSSGALTMTM